MIIEPFVHYYRQCGWFEKESNDLVDKKMFKLLTEN